MDQEDRDSTILMMEIKILKEVDAIVEDQEISIPAIEEEVHKCTMNLVVDALMVSEEEVCHQKRWVNNQEVNKDPLEVTFKVIEEEATTREI